MVNRQLGTRDYFFLLAISAFNFIMFAVHLGTYRWFRYDEVAYVTAARELIDGRLYNIEHPPIGKYIITLGIKLFGDNPDGWRIFSVVAGVVGIVMVYLLAKRMFGGYWIPTVASLFVSVETYWFASARLAMLDMFLVTLVLVSFYYIWRYYQEGKSVWLYSAAVSIGLATGVKWTGVFIFIMLLGVIILRIKDRRISRIIFSALIMCGVYVSIYLPLYIMVPETPPFIALHQEMLRFHTSFRTGADWFNGGIIQWFQSFPIQGGAAYDNPITWQRVYQVVYSGNIIILWTGLATLIATGMRLVRKREPRLKFLVLGALAIALPWIIIPGTWNVYLPLVPIIALILAYWGDQICRLPGRLGKIGVGVFVILAIMWYLVLLPRLWPLLYVPGFIDTLII